MAAVIILALIILLLVWFLLQFLSRAKEMQESQNQVMIQASQDQAKSMLAMASLLSQQANLIASQDALTYQALMATTPTLVSEPEKPEEELQPLDEAEYQRIYDKHMRGEVLTDNERVRFEHDTFGI
jgi:hypothetical protein